MAKAKRTKRMYRWRISPIKATPAKLVGYVDAPDADAAIKEAIKEYEVKDRDQKRLVALRDG
jgi:hypothetical protein